MREIKFRAWLIDFEMMVFSNNQAETDLCEIWTIVENGVHVETQETLWKEGGGETYEEIRYVECSQAVMQYTGLKDKNGVEIYEGDILDCQDRIVQVVWNEQAGQWDTDFIRYIFSLCSNGITNQEWKYRAIVIGNIHQNKDLLK